MHVPALIEKKRDGGELDESDIQYLIRGFVDGSIPDYQMSAFAMAVYYRGMSESETFALTEAMMRSGSIFHWPEGSPEKIDKHSTGGIGDKVSLVLAPLLACGKFWVPMISGRGLGITGGTLDKLESIPGFNVHVDRDDAVRQLEIAGVVMMGQTDDICPADKKLYALRDVTATVPSLPLIVSSIMSKKLAESLDHLVLDVKFGAGAFMKTKSDAQKLADTLVAVGDRIGVVTTAHLTPMSEPLGRCVGNALEVAEAVDCLRGNGPADLEDLTLSLAESVSAVPQSQLKQWLHDGSAWRKFRQLVELQGGDVAALESISDVHQAKCIKPYPAQNSGTIRQMNAELIGRASLHLGAGRKTSHDGVDHAAGFSALRKCGEHVDRGEPLFLIHANSRESMDRIMPLLNEAVEIC